MNHANIDFWSKNNHGKLHYRVQKKVEIKKKMSFQLDELIKYSRQLIEIFKNKKILKIGKIQKRKLLKQRLRVHKQCLTELARKNLHAVNDHLIKFKIVGEFRRLNRSRYSNFCFEPLSAKLTLCTQQDDI